MAVLAKQRITQSGLAPTYAAAAAGGDSFVNDQADGSRTFLHVKNTGGSSITVKIDDPNTQMANATTFDPDLSVAVPATTGDRFIGPVGPRFIDSNGNTSWTYSATPTGVTVAVLHF